MSGVEGRGMSLRRRWGPSALPVVRIPVKMHDRHHHNLVIEVTEENSEGKGSHKAAADIESHDWGEAWVDLDPLGCLLDGSEEVFAEVLTLGLIPCRRIPHLGFRLGMEAQGFHVKEAKAFSKTVLASRRMTDPRSTSWQRRRSSRFHAGRRGIGPGVSKLSSSFSATNARTGGGNSSASATICATCGLMPEEYACLEAGSISCEGR